MCVQANVKIIISQESKDIIQEAMKICTKQNLLFINPDKVAELLVIGAATCAKEVYDQCPNIESFVVPLYLPARGWPIVSGISYFAHYHNSN